MLNGNRDGAFALGLIIGFGLSLNLVLWINFSAWLESNEDASSESVEKFHTIRVIWKWLGDHSDSISTFSVLIAALGIYLVFKRLNQTDRIEISSNTINLMKNLQQDDIRKARAHCLNDLRVEKPPKRKEKNYFQADDGLFIKKHGSYDDEDRRCASLVCSSYDMAGIIIENQLVNREAIVNSWGPSIIGCYKVLRGHIKAQQERHDNKLYWSHFGLLEEHARRFHEH